MRRQWNTFNVARLCFSLIVLMLGGIRLGAAQAGAETVPVAPGQQYAVVTYYPLTGKGLVLGQPVLLFTLNNAVPAAFVVDTGSNQSLVSDKVSEQLNLHLEPGVTGDGRQGYTLGKPSVTGRVQSMMAGGLHLSRIPLIVLKQSAFDLGVNYDGILGIDVLQHFTVLMDPQSHTLTVWLPGGLQPWQVEKLGFAHAYVLPIIQNKDSGHWYVQGRFTSGGISDQEAMLIDTGADTTLISDRVAQHLQLKPTGQEKLVDLYSHSFVSHTRVEQAQFGGLALLNLSVGTRPTTKDEPAVLGMDVLSGYKVLMDFPGGKVYLLPNPATVPAITVGPAPSPPPANLTPPAAP